MTATRQPSPTTRTVSQVSMPQDARALSTLPRIDYEDAFAIDSRCPAHPGAMGPCGAPGRAPGRTPAMWLGWTALGLKLWPPWASNRVLGWKVKHSDNEFVLLAADSWLGLRGQLLFRSDPHGLLFATFVQHTNPAVRALWPAVTPRHVHVVRSLLDTPPAGSRGLTLSGSAMCALASRAMRQGGGFRRLLVALVGAGASVGAVVAYGAAPAAAAVPDFGNPNGHFYVPPAGRAVNTDHPNHVVGNGRPASCTSAAVVRDVAAGGIITFNCGRKPVTIVMTATASVIKTRRLVVLDGGGLVTLSGGGKRRILYSDTCAGTWSTDDCVNQPYPRIVVQNMTLEDGYDGAHQAICTANIPRCWYGGVDGGGAIYVEGGQFRAVNSRFIDNRCYAYGPDLGGGAIRALAQYENRPVYVSNDTFSGGRCSNGGALSSISVQWDVLNSGSLTTRPSAGGPIRPHAARPAAEAAVPSTSTGRTITC